MHRDIETLQRDDFDLLVIGAGAHGVFAALDASRRGLRVALIDSGDLGGATSHNSLRTLHGGIRYLQYLQFARTAESIHEQALLRRMAPDMTAELPFIMPCSGWGMRGPVVMFAGLQLHQALRLTLTSQINNWEHLPRSRILTSGSSRRRAPGVVTNKLTGAALWSEVQILDTNALLLRCAQQSAAAGATIANYVAARELTVNERGDTIDGARCVDRLSGTEFNIRATLTINATGPWAEPFLRRASGALQNQLRPMPIALNESWNIVLKRQLFADAAVALPSAQRVEGDAVADANRMYFVVPWRERSVIGTVQVPWADRATNAAQFNTRMAEFLTEINAALPSAALTADDIAYVYWGRVPTEDALTDDGQLRRDADEVVDHLVRDRIGGLLSIVGVKLTTARLVAEHAIDQAFAQLPQPSQQGTMAEVRLAAPTLDPRLPSAGQLSDSKRFAEYVAICVNEQMALTPEDVLERRSDLAILGQPTDAQRALLTDALPDTPQPLSR